MRARRLLHDEGGATVVEFALAVPILIFLLVGIMQIGILFHANGGIRELMGWSGRRAIILYQNSTKPADAVFTNEITTEAGTGGYGLVTSRLTPVLLVSENTGLGYRSVQITLRYSVPLSLPLMPNITVNLDQTRTYFAPF